MAEISQYSTPTISFKFKTINPSDITWACFALKCGDTTINKSISDAVVGTDTLSFTLAQDDTKKLTVGLSARAMCGWMVGTTRGRSHIRTYEITEPAFPGVQE